MPLASIVSLLRGLLTKNACVMKTPSQDPYTLHHVVATFADGIAHDVCEYDQGACFSARQVVVVRSEVDALRRAQGAVLEEYTTLLPHGVWSEDTRARLRMARDEHAMLGAEVDGPEDGSWTVVVDEAGPLEDHLLHRTVHLQVVDDVATGEFGLRRAVGAKPLHLRAQIVAETLVVATIAGGSGALFGFSIPLVISRINGWTTIADPLPLLAVLPAAGLLGIISGLLPARKASRIDPSFALRQN